MDLFVGCCVADLLHPSALAAQVVEMANDGGGILYLPITFTGNTEILRENKINKQIIRQKKGLFVPTDKEVFDSYHSHLEERGHYLDTEVLLDTLGAFGCSVIIPDDDDENENIEIIVDQIEEYLGDDCIHVYMCVYINVCV